MRKKSFLRRVAVYMAVLVAEIRQEAASLLQVYGGDVKSRVARMDETLNDLLLRNSAQLLLLKSAGEAKRFYASQDIHNYLADMDKLGAGVSGLAVADADFGICVEASSSRATYWERAAFRDYASERAQARESQSDWRFVTLCGRPFLCRVSEHQGRAAAVFAAADELLSLLPTAPDGRATFALTDGAGSVVAVRGGGLAGLQAGQPLDDAAGNAAFRLSYDVLAGRVGLSAVVRGGMFWTQTRVMMVVVAAVMLVTLLFGVLLFRYVRREMIAPMSRMAEDMRRIDAGEYDLRITGEYDTREFTQLQDSFNRLMDELMRAKIASYEKRIALWDMEMRTIRLQIRPHFFLNALTTLSSLSSQGRNQEVKTYAEALSRNIRYMFKSGLHTVPVGEEMAHIEDYFDMQECRYPNCIFHFVELPEHLASWQIPQMLVQTFIENEYKYAVSVDSLLTLLIRVSTQEKDGEEMLLIRIEDDGKGYPQDVLRYMNGEAPRPERDGERVGLWSVKRMMALMYERDDLVTLENIAPHGCVNLILVPKTPKRQMEREEA